MVDSRKPTAAGLFYPAKRDELASRVRGLLDSSTRASPARASRAKRVKAIVAPHGHYDTSGPIAAAAWARVAACASHLRRLVVLGPAHHVPFMGMAAPVADAFETPLGAIEIDRVAIETVRRWPQVVLGDAPHGQEHSIEMQLPFAQTLLASPTLVPLALGDATDEEIAAVLETLWNDETLIVLSTDLSRYHDAGTAKRLDEATGRAIELMRPDAIPSERACADSGLRALLRFAKNHAFRATQIALHRAPSVASDLRSGDANAEVFGYGAFAFT